MKYCRMRKRNKPAQSFESMRCIDHQVPLQARKEKDYPKSDKQTGLANVDRY